MAWVGGIYECAKIKINVAKVGAASKALTMFGRRNRHGIMVPVPENENWAHCTKVTDSEDIFPYPGYRTVLLVDKT